LNDLERRNGVILRCFSEFRYLPGALRKRSRSLSHLLKSSCINTNRNNDECILEDRIKLYMVNAYKFRHCSSLMIFFCPLSGIKPDHLFGIQCVTSYHSATHPHERFLY